MMDYSDTQCDEPSLTKPQISMPELNPIMESDINLLQESLRRQAHNEDISKKISSLKHELERDIKAADLKWSMFVAASNTYHYSSCLKPFPPMYIKNKYKEIEALREAIEHIPPLAVVLKELKEPNVQERYGPAIELLHWVLVKMGDPYFKFIHKDAHKRILNKVPSEMTVAEPNLIFEVVSSKRSTAEERWKKVAQDHTTFFAYHGSRFENFHSIIHYGLQQSMCKQSTFGKGIYLSSELGLSFPYSPVGYGWGGCIFGSRMSCVALCELVNHPDVKTGSPGDSRSTLVNSMNVKVPNKYYVVSNSDLLRVRYLLVYIQKTKKPSCTDNTGVLAWFKQHKLLTFVIGYVVLLASVGLTHNKQVEKYYRLFVQKAGFE